MQNLIVAQGNTNPYPELELYHFDKITNMRINMKDEIYNTLEINDITKEEYLR